ncbi:ribonuclease VapC [Salinarimonas ramus]|uniref:Ribonuclease VapC n=2 Tax=Salinarimonas ramus TaxID=690164 RepID=A0A917QGQ4_9HYPH|nr:ribonuclease VapC [Salinarimonas ramus]
MLDTNICIHIRRSRDPRVLARFQQLSVGSAVMSVITFGELRLYVEKAVSDVQEARLTKLIALVPALPLGPDVAIAYGRIRADLERRGAMIGGNDLWIAAHALSLGLTLVTANVREFERVPDLVVEDWTA